MKIASVAMDFPTTPFQPVPACAPKWLVRATFTVLLMYCDETIAHPSSIPDASTLKKKNVTSALNERFLYSLRGKSARSMTAYLTLLFSGRRFRTMNATATHNELN